MDLSNTVAVSVAQRDAVKALVIDNPYSIGQSLAREIGYALIGKPVPAYIQVPAIVVTPETLLDAYAQSYHVEPPPEVTDLLKK
jgi:ribose transport system substrate-binding protein